MAGSLQDQLLNMGVASKQQAKQAKQAKRKKAKQKKAGVEGDTPAEDISAKIAQERQQKIERDRELNRQREEQLQSKQNAAKAKQLVERYAVPLPEEGEVAYNFTHDSKIKKIYVDSLQQEMLAVGTLAVVELNNKYHLLPAEITEKIATVLPEMVISHHQKEQVDDDDPYKDFQIPDDLMW